MPAELGMPAVAASPSRRFPRAADIRAPAAGHRAPAAPAGTSGNLAGDSCSASTRSRMKHDEYRMS
jgi:hypothetical protein